MIEQICKDTIGVVEGVERDPMVDEMDNLGVPEAQEDVCARLPEVALTMIAVGMDDQREDDIDPMREELRQNRTGRRDARASGSTGEVHDRVANPNLVSHRGERLMENNDPTFTETALCGTNYLEVREDEGNRRNTRQMRKRRRWMWQEKGKDVTNDQHSLRQGTGNDRTAELPSFTVRNVSTGRASSNLEDRPPQGTSG
ncbi:hypothetical protein NE237_030527 [Protea cynaroides]|uniref:Uncharacterized protein n=1 Tax=Protea cynaroides TaxID=273540 RepID=A0A9Q0GWC7_9MAGN|nr:hypothetical protein NE237_030527 [Protea cynaroides]